MSTGRDTIRAVRAAAVWLLMVAVFFGPAGLAGSAGYSAALGASCPCDDAEGGHLEDASSHSGDGTAAVATSEHDCDDCDEHADCDHGSADHAQADHADDHPCKDACPDDCPNCGCCLGVAMAVLPLTVMSSATAWISVPMLAPAVAPSRATATGVFRPPRAA